MTKFHVATLQPDRSDSESSIHTYGGQPTGTRTYYRFYIRTDADKPHDNQYVEYSITLPVPDAITLTPTTTTYLTYSGTVTCILPGDIVQTYSLGTHATRAAAVSEATGIIAYACGGTNNAFYEITSLTTSQTTWGWLAVCGANNALGSGSGFATASAAQVAADAWVEANCP